MFLGLLGAFLLIVQALIGLMIFAVGLGTAVVGARSKKRSPAASFDLPQGEQRFEGNGE